MTGLQAAKAVVRAHHAEIEMSTAADVATALARHTSPDWHWRGMHPMNEQAGAEAVATAFWGPLKHAMTALARREDVFFAGENGIADVGGTWVASMGHLIGLFDHPWLGIRPTGKIVMLRYAEFHRVEGDRITETAQYFDIPHLMQQAGQNPFGPATGQHLVQPGPATHDGLIRDPRPEAEGVETLALIERMIADIGSWQSGLPLEEELRRTWHEDMLWWGPAGIGATYTIPRYARQHAGVFRGTFRDRKRVGHRTRFAEGMYGGFFGWPSFTAVPSGGFMGLPATDTPVEFRVVDIYRRSGDRLAENWIFIDMLHMLAQQGVDVLARMETIGP